MDGKRLGNGWWKWISTTAVGASVVVFMLPTLWHYMERWEVRPDDFRASWLVLAIVLSIVVRPLNALGWQMILGAFGHRMPFHVAGRIWFVAESCRWLPGGVWHFGSRAMQCSSLGVPMPVVVASMGLELLLTIAASMALGLAGAAVYGSREIGMNELLSLQGLAIGALSIMAAAMLGLAVHLYLRRFAKERYAAIRERFSSLRRIHPGTLVTVVCLVYFVGVAALNGLAFYATVLAVAPDAGVPWFAAVAANSLAWMAGLVAVMAPAGLGVRDGLLVLQMSVWMRLGDAILVAVLWRGLLLGVELLWVLIAGASPLLAKAYERTASSRDAKSVEDLRRIGEEP